MGFLAYIMDTRVSTGRPSSISNVPVVCEFPDVIPEELSGVPPKSQVELQIDLIPGVAPISKAPYRLVPPEMPELSSHLQELLGEGFY